MTLEQQLEALLQEIDELNHQLEAKQAIIDSLMLEYCPQEMSKEQLETWAIHQQVADIEEVRTP